MYLCLCDCCKSFCFHPFREIVNCDEQELHLSFPLLQGTHNVDSPLCERPGRGNSRHLFTWNSLNVPVSLATITFLHEFRCVLLHRGPEIAHPHDLPDQLLCPHVISANPSVYFFQDVFGLFPLYASQVGLGVSSFVQLVIQYRKPGSTLLDFPGFLRVLG